jgi:hypothetical protein
MSPIEKIDGHVDALLGLHEGFQMQLRGLLGEALDRPDGHTERARVEFRQAVRDLRVQMSQRLAGNSGANFVTSIAMDLHDQALEDAGLELNDQADEAIASLVRQLIDETEELIRTSLRLDEESLMALYRKIQLRAGMQAATGVNPRIALNMVKGGAISGLRFTRADRSGKRWTASVFTRTAARGMLIRIYCETFLMALLSNGRRSAKLETDDGELVFDIIADYEAVAEERLHPNATRVVTHA